MPPTPPGLITALRALVAQRPMDLERLARRARVPVGVTRRLLSRSQSPRLLAQVEGFLHATGASLMAVIDGQAQEIRLVRAIPRAVPVAVPPETAYHGKSLRGDTSPVAGETHVQSLREILRGILRARTRQDLSAWETHRAAAAAGLTAGVRLAVCLDQNIPALTTLERILAALGIALVIHRGPVTWHWGRESPLPADLLVTPDSQRHRPGARLGARTPLAPSPLVKALVLVGRLHDRAGFAQAKSFGLSAARLGRWRRAGVDQDLATLESAVVALGGRLVLAGATSVRILPIRLPKGRLRLVLRDAASARRSSVANATGLTGDPLEHELHVRVTRYRQKLLRQLALAEPGPPATSMTEWVCRRRETLRDGGEPWSILALSLVTGLSRMAIKRLLERQIDEQPVLRLLEQLQLALVIEPAQDVH
jgi:hypothetical protein